MDIYVTILGNGLNSIAAANTQEHAKTQALQIVANVVEGAVTDAAVNGVGTINLNTLRVFKTELNMF